jgi:hypothetical protein
MGSRVGAYTAISKWAVKISSGLLLILLVFDGVGVRGPTFFRKAAVPIVDIRI